VPKGQAPIQNVQIESSTQACVKNASMNTFSFSLDDARSKIERWRVAYNRERPNSSCET
jgi:hypothetical protein